MGLFKSIKKIGKKIFKGLKKKFKKGLIAFGKIAGSKWGKILMLASSIFTGGMALAAGFSSFTGTAGGFMVKFVAGAKGFMGGLTSPLTQAKKMMGAGATVGQTTGALAGAAQAAKPMKGVLQGVTQAGQTVGAQLPAALQVPGKALTAGLQGLQQAPPPGAGGGWLSKAAGFAADFIKSEGGAGLIKGVGEGMAAEEKQKHEDRFRRAWADPNNPFAKLTAGGGEVEAPTGPAPVPSFGGQTYAPPQQPQGGQF
jgi:hypothetical protein